MTIALNDDHTAEMDESVTSKEEIQTDVSYKVPDCDSNGQVSPPASPSSEDQPKDEWLDILGNGQLKKRVIKKGQEDTKPQKGDICTVKIIGMLDDGTVVEGYDDVAIQVGDLEVVQGLDLTIVLMELGEVADVKVDPRFAYGTRGDGHIPPNATITYTVELKVIEEEPDIETLSINQRRELGNKKRQRGNWWFVRKEFNSAIRCYRRALEFLKVNDSTKWNENETEVTDTELQALLDDSIKVYNNLAAALIETGAYSTALDNAETVLKYQPTNTKALFRKGKILKLKGEFGKAYITFREAQKLDPDMKSLQTELTSLKERISKESTKEKLFYAKMLGMKKDDAKIKEPKNIKIKDMNTDKSRLVTKGILWTLFGASVAVVGILVHKFTS